MHTLLLSLFLDMLLSGLHINVYYNNKKLQLVCKYHSTRIPHIQRTLLCKYWTITINNNPNLLLKLVNIVTFMINGIAIILYQQIVWRTKWESIDFFFQKPWSNQNHFDCSTKIRNSFHTRIVMFDWPWLYCNSLQNQS